MRNCLTAAMLLGLAAPAAAQTEDALNVDLVCPGRGELRRSVPHEERDRDGKKRTTYEQQRRFVEGDVQLRLRPGKGEALLPRVMTDTSGWQEIRKLVVTADAVDGKVDVALLYAPKLHVERSTGMLTISGSMSDFTGRCRPFRPEEKVF